MSTNQKRQIDYDGLMDFGFSLNTIQNGKVEYIKCDDQSFGFSNSQLTQNGDLSTGSFFNLNDILSGGSLEIPLSDVLTKTQAELALDNNISTSLAYFGSVYSTVQIAVNDIRENYPNGFLIIDAITGVNAIMFNSSDTYTYGGVPFRVIDNSDYELVQTYNDVYDRTFDIISQITGTTFSLFLEVDGQPSDGTGYGHILQPKNSTLDKFYSSISKYELDLLVPPYSRSNYWPRDLVAQNNILLDGPRYESFIEEELSWATDSDDEDTNFMWRKLYPDGQKNLDSDDGLIQKLVLTFAMNFDNIKRYQDQLRYQHTIGYGTSNHISKDLVGLIANQWNWDIGHSLNQDDYSKYIYSTYDNYVTGQSQQKISSRDVNFEIQRRVLTNLITLYKKKGTRDAIKYIANMYGLPEELFCIEELVKTGTKGEITETESNIVVPINGNIYYVDYIGSARTISNFNIVNTKYLNINISPFDAIDFDFYDWGSGSHPNITNINGKSSTISSSTETTKNEFFNTVYRNTIKSDGSSRYEMNYPILENEGKIYYSVSPNKINLSTLDPYMNFLDDNWNILIGNLIPASSRVLSIGNLYKNPMWRREKFKWNSSELEPISLPVNDDIQLITISDPIVNFSKIKSSIVEIGSTDIQIEKRASAIVESPRISSTDISNMVSNIEIPHHSVNISNRMSSTVSLSNIDNCEYIEQLSDSDEIDYEYSGETYQIGSPIFEPISDEFGTLDYTNYTGNSLIISNQKTVDIPFSGYNLSDSGYTKFEIELFKREYENSTVLDDGIEYRVTSVVRETDRYGEYLISTIGNLILSDNIYILSDYLPYINNSVLITDINEEMMKIRTFPSIGLLNIPLSSLESSGDINYFESIGAIDQLRSINKFVSIGDMIEILNKMYNGSTVTNMEWPISSMFEWFEDKDKSSLKISILILKFIQLNQNYTLSEKYNILINAIISEMSVTTFKRVVDFFDWTAPIQQIEYSNYDISDGDFSLPIIDVESRSSGNLFSTSGNVRIGGLTSLNSDILVDKEEYFYRNKCITHAPIEWGNVPGVDTFYPSGGTLISSNYDVRTINNIRYYGRYFTFINTPKMPISSLQNITDNILADASVTAIWNGVGDSDRLELQYLKVYSSDTPYLTYSSITESAWTGNSATTIPIPAAKNVGDDYIYNIQTTLEGDTYYWWRVKNFRGKLNMFGHNLECFTSTKPYWFKTGTFVNIGGNDGEVPVEPTPPIKTGKIPDITS